MKTYVLSLLLVVFCQTDVFSQSKTEIPTDSINTEFLLFKTSVLRMELVKVEPICQTSLRFNYDINKNEMVEVCFPSTVVFGEEIDGEWQSDFKMERISGNVTLDEVDTDSLFRILFESKPSNMMTMCYEPRHGILFYGVDDEIIGFIELCFECTRHKATTGIPYSGDLMNGAYRKIRQIFNKYGFE